MSDIGDGIFGMQRFIKKQLSKPGRQELINTLNY